MNLSLSQMKGAAVAIALLAPMSATASASAHEGQHPDPPDYVSDYEEDNPRTGEPTYEPTYEPTDEPTYEPTYEPAGEPTLDRSLTDPEIRESSGLVTSTYDPTLLWTHNDSGDSNRIFAVGQAGNTEAVLTVAGAGSRDWEDIDAGPGHTLWVGDIGDNAEQRRSIQVYVLSEPENPVSGQVAATEYTLAYEDGPHNAETVMVNPVSGRLYVVSKATDGGPGGIYEAPSTLTTTGTNTLTKIASAPGRITAGDFAPDGETFMIRSQIRGYLYSSFTSTPREIPLPSMRQGESLTFGADASSVLLGSEGLDSPVYRMSTGMTVDPTMPPGEAPTSPGTTPGTYGPVTRSAPSGTYVTPEQYGAKGDGRIDDTNEMQKALDAAAGGTLWLPAGKTYSISQTIAVPSNTTVVGAGNSSVIRFTWAGVRSTDSGGGSHIRSKGDSATDIHLSNFVLEGGGTGYPGGLKAGNPEGLVPMLKLILVDNFSVKNMELRNASGLTISYTGSSNGVFQNNWVHHSGRDGITGYRNQNRNVTDILIDSNLIEKVGDDAIAINGLVPGHDMTAMSSGSNPLPTRITITNNVIQGWESDPNGELLGRGIALNGVAGVLVEDNTIAYPNSTGILLTGCNTHICAGSSTDWSSTDAQLIDNTISYSTGGSRPGAIAILKTTRSVVTGNMASHSAPYDFSGCGSCSIVGNSQ